MTAEQETLDPQEQQEQEPTTDEQEQESEDQDDAGSVPTFAELGLTSEVLKALEEMEYESPTDVQAAAIPIAMARKDLLVQSRTGTGKTAAFGAPMVQHLLGAEARPRALILAPTRELALQVADEIGRIATPTSVKVTAIYGGAAMGPQIDALKSGTHIVAGTPGRVLDHIRRRNLDTSAIDTLVLDEGDEMLSMGFLEEITSIIDQLPEDRHTMVFSATIPEEIQKLADRYTREPDILRLSEDFIGVREIQHVYYLITGSDRTGDLSRVLEFEQPDTSLVFCNTRDDTALVAHYLQKNGFKAEGISSDLTQKERERVMQRMRNKELQFLVATDIAARGIDLSDLTHVINYSFPESADVYIHRTGRTGRAGKSGVAVSLVSPREIGSFYYLKLIHKIFPEERHLPSAHELATRREAARYEQLTSLCADRDVTEEMRGLARRVWSTADGERLVAMALAVALDEKGEVFPAPVVQPRKERESQGRDRDKDGDRDRDRDRRPRGRGSDDRRPRRSNDRDRDRGRRPRRGDDRRPRRGDDRRPRRDDRGDRNDRDRGRGDDRGPRTRDRKTTRTRRPEGSDGAFTTPDGDVERWELVDDGDRGRPTTPPSEARLFINLGRHQGMRVSDLYELVLAETDLVKDQVVRVQVRSSYSFFNVPAENADVVIDQLTGKSFGDREVRVERAKER